jgi:hypothetical protein
MKKLYLLPIILLVNSVNGCQPANRQANDNSATAVHADSAIRKNSSYKNDQSQQQDDDDDSQRPEDIMMVEKFLRHLFKNEIESDLINPMSRQFQLQSADLNGDEKNEIFVALTGPYFCGSGGCTFLLLDHTGKLNTRFTVSSYPVIVDSTSTHGWRDLLVQSQGKFHRLKFTGSRYPSNPSTAPIITFFSSNHLLSIFDSWEEKKEWHVF